MWRSATGQTIRSEPHTQRAMNLLNDAGLKIETGDQPTARRRRQTLFKQNAEQIPATSHGLLPPVRRYAALYNARVPGNNALAGVPCHWVGSWYLSVSL